MKKGRRKKKRIDEETKGKINFNIVIFVPNILQIIIKF